MKKSALLAIALLLLIPVMALLSACQQVARFEIASLLIEPSEVAPGETATITVTVANIGVSTGTYKAILTVNGATVSSQEIMLQGGASQSVTFTLSRDTPGSYQVSVGNKSSTLVVKETPEVQVIPEEYKSLYTNLKLALDRFGSYLDSQSTTTRYPVIFGAELLPANCNRGTDLLKPQTMQGVILFLERLKELGIQGVTIPIGYPLYTPDFPSRVLKKSLKIADFVR